LLLRMIGGSVESQLAPRGTFALVTVTMISRFARLPTSLLASANADSEQPAIWSLSLA